MVKHQLFETHLKQCHGTSKQQDKVIIYRLEDELKQIMEEFQRDYQGDTIEIVGRQDVEAWHNSIKELDALFDSERNL